MGSIVDLRKACALWLCFSLFFVGCAQAAPPDTAMWANVGQLRSGQKIKVVQTHRMIVTGSFLGFTDDSISLKTSQGDKTINRGEISEVTKRGGRHLRHGLIGAAIGGAGGVATGAAAAGCKVGSYGPCFSRGAAAAEFGSFTAVLGFLIGIAIPGNTVIYRAPAP